MKKYMLLFLLVCSLATVHAQQTYDTTKWQMMVRGTDTFFMKKPSKADVLFQQGDYTGAVAEFRRMLREGDADPSVTYNLACTYATLGNNDSAFFFLPMALEYDSSIYVLTDPDFTSLLTDPRWKQIEDRQIKLQRMKGIRYRNPRLTRELWRMLMRDQAYYSQIKVAGQKYGMDNKISDSLWVLKEQLNKENLKRLEQIIQDYGWPGISLVGHRAANAAFLIIQHSDLETQKKYKPMLMAACNKRDADWDALALLIDRIEVNEGRPQVYGSQVRYNKDKEVYEPFPVADEHNLDRRRKEVGLPPARNYYANWDIDYTVEQNP